MRFNSTISEALANMRVIDLQYQNLLLQDHSVPRIVVPFKARQVLRAFSLLVSIHGWAIRLCAISRDAIELAQFPIRIFINQMIGRATTPTAAPFSNFRVSN